MSKGGQQRLESAPLKGASGRWPVVGGGDYPVWRSPDQRHEIRSSAGHGRGPLFALVSLADQQVLAVERSPERALEAAK